MVLAYAHLSQWWISGEETEAKNSSSLDNIHFHADGMILSPNALLSFGIVFFLIGIFSLVCSILGKWKGVFICFVAAMILIWIRISVGIR